MYAWTVCFTVAVLVKAFVSRIYTPPPAVFLSFKCNGYPKLLKHAKIHFIREVNLEIPGSYLNNGYILMFHQMFSHESELKSLQVIQTPTQIQLLKVLHFSLEQRLKLRFWHTSFSVINWTFSIFSTISLVRKAILSIRGVSGQSWLFPSLGRWSPKKIGRKQ